MYDVDGNGTLDEEELQLMLTQLAVPASTEEFDRAIEWVDKDGNGVLDPKEFIVLYMYLETGAFPAGHQPPEDFWDGIETTWHNADGNALDVDHDDMPDGAVMQQKFSKAEAAKRALTKAALHGSNMYKLYVAGNSTHHVLARRILAREAKMAAAAQARLQFRFHSPPRIVCPACDETFTFYAMLEEHVGWSACVCPVKGNKIRSMALRYGLRKPARVWRAPENEEETMMPERFRMFAEHRVKVEREYEGRKGQGRVADPRPKLFGRSGEDGAGAGGDADDDGFGDVDDDDLATTDDDDDDDYDEDADEY